MPTRSMVWNDATVPVMTTLLARYWFVSCPVRFELVVAYVIVFVLLGASVWEQVAAPGLSAVLLAVVPVTTIPRFGVVAFFGFDGLES